MTESSEKPLNINIHDRIQVNMKNYIKCSAYADKQNIQHILSRGTLLEYKVIKNNRR